MTPERELIEDYSPRVETDFSKIKVGMKTLQDAVYQLGNYRYAGVSYTDKKKVIDAMARRDYRLMRKMSNFYYNTSGIYSRLCRYMAYLYRYDWVVTPYVDKSGKSEVKDEKVLEGFYKSLTYLDNFEVKKVLGEIALKVIRNGCYYGYKVPQANKMVLQELPVDYCRTRFSVNNRPAVEFNMAYFDDHFHQVATRMRILDLFPKEFKKGYALYKQGKLVPDFEGDSAGWYLLDVNSVVKFNINGDDQPFFCSVIPAILDLDTAKELDKKKMEQKLLKIIIQKMPIDKNGDLVFDIDEAQALHNNAVRMLGKAIGIDVLTTFADVDVANMETTNAASDDDAMERTRQAIYDDAGVPQLVFNSNTNVALQNSILNDEATMYNLITQFEGFLNDLMTPFNKNKKISYKVQILTTTIYNYKEMAKLFKEQTQLGYSKMLPQIALGQSQSSILASAEFETKMLNLFDIFIPPMSSNTMNAAVLSENQNNNKSNSNKKQSNNLESNNNGAGRPEKSDSEKSDKTLANKESL